MEWDQSFFNDNGSIYSEDDKQQFKNQISKYHVCTNALYFQLA